MTGHINVMLVLQSCTDTLQVLPGSSSVTFPISCDGTCHIGHIKVEEVNVKTEKVIVSEEEECIDIKDKQGIYSEEEEEEEEDIETKEDKDVDVKEEVSCEDRL